MGERKLLGMVAVDSATLLIADPWVIRNEWEDNPAIRWIEFWGVGAETVAASLRETNIDVADIGKRYRVDADKCSRQTLREMAHQAGFKLFTEGKRDDQLERIWNTGTGEVEDLSGVAVETEADGIFPVYGVYEGGVLVRVEIGIDEED